MTTNLQAFTTHLRTTSDPDRAAQRVREADYWRERGQRFIEALAELADEREAEGNTSSAAHYRDAHEAARVLVTGGE